MLDKVISFGRKLASMIDPSRSVALLRRAAGSFQELPGREANLGTESIALKTLLPVFHLQTKNKTKTGVPVNGSVVNESN